MRQPRRAQPIEVHIDRLVLEGLPSGDHAAIAESIRQELARLLAHTGLTADGDSMRIDTGEVTLSAGNQPSQVGASVARAVHRSLH